MRVVSMALLECTQWLLMGLATILGFASFKVPFIAYIAMLIPPIILVIYISMIPLNLNWSRGLYSHILKKGLLFLVFIIGFYALLYYSLGVIVPQGANPTFGDALYLSSITLSTVGYGDVTPSHAARIISSIEALLGLFTMPVIGSIVWLYCQERLNSKTMDASILPKEFKITVDKVTGHWYEIENEETRKEQNQRNSKFKLSTCKYCKKQQAEIRKYYDILGRLSPLPRFIVVCQCDNFTKDYSTAYQAAWAWNRKNPLK